MPLSIDPNVPLPEFRVDLRLYKGPTDHDGAPTYNLFDPVKGQYYKINWEQAAILQHLKPGITLNELCHEINLQSLHKVHPDDIRVFFEDAYKYDFLHVQKSSEHLIQQVQSSKMSYLQSLFFRYLYFRIPIIKPDHFLEKTLPYLLPLVSPFALICYFIAASIGIFILISRFSEYINTFTYFFNLNGLISYFVGLVVFKLIHEFSHAYTAKYFNIHIPSMGIAFIFLTPVLYTDATDSWKLSDRKDRLKISAAGLISELILAAICTLGWALSPPGIFQSIFFVISSIIWISSLLINANPAMRFDGYYLLSDFIGIDNLQARSFAMLRWWLHSYFFGLDLPCPEEQLSRKLQVFMIVYSIFTWIYRLFLYTSIALFFYLVNVKFKVLGLFLLIATIVWLIVIPILIEIKTVWDLRKKMSHKWNFVFFMILLLTMLSWLSLPFPHQMKFSAVAIATQKQTIYAPADGQVISIFVKRGERVSKEQPLLELSSISLNKKIEDAQVRKKIAERELLGLNLDEKRRLYFKEKERELESIKHQLLGFRELKKNMDIKSMINGTIMTWNEELKVGQYVTDGEQIGIIVEPTFKILAYMPESSFEKLKINQKGEFYSNRTHQYYKGYIQSISPTRAAYLNYPQLASINRGDIPVVETTAVQSGVSHPKLLESMFIVEMGLDQPNPQFLYGEQGTLKIRGPWLSYVEMGIKYLERLFWKESGL